MPEADRARPTIALLGAPIEVGASEPGAAMGPAALRTAGLARALERLGYTVEDSGDAVPDAPAEDVALGEGRANNAGLVAAWARMLHDRAHALMKEGRLPIFLGGDHAMAMGTISGVARYWRETGRDLCVLWLDAHADFNTPATTPSGNMHGMPVAMLCGEPVLETILGDRAPVALDPAKVIQFGIRSIDDHEREVVTGRGVTVIDMRQIDEFGVSALMRDVIARVKASGAVLHLSFDIDVLDPSIAPAVATTVAGGLTYREAHLIMEMLHDSGLVASVDLAELNPFLDVRGQSAKLLVDLTASLFGRRIIGRAL
jgi:arginase